MRCMTAIPRRVDELAGEVDEPARRRALPPDLTGDQDSEAVSPGLQSHGTPIQRPVMEQAQGEAVGDVVGPVVGVPLYVSGLKTEQFVVHPQIEFADRAALVVCLEHFPAEAQAARSAEDNHPSSLGRLANEGRELSQAHVGREAGGFEDFVVQGWWEVPIHNELGGLDGEFRIRFQESEHLLRETPVNVAVPQLGRRQIFLVPRTQD